MGLIAITLIAVAIPVAVAAPTGVVTRTGGTTSSPQWGVFAPGFPPGQAVLDGVVAKTGPLQIVHWFVQWDGWTGNPGGYSWSDQEPVVRGLLEAGITPMITWEAWGSPGAPPAYGKKIDFPLADIAAGKFDSYVDSWAIGAASAQGTVYMRVFHEPNHLYSPASGSGYPWSTRNAVSAAEYVAAWRHIVDRFRAAGATNVKWVFNLGNDIGNNPFASDAYPGDDYVDMIGWDAYGGGTGSVEIDFQHTRVLSKERPMLIGEASGPATWVSSELTPLVRKHRIGVVWFDEGEFSIEEHQAAQAIRAMIGRAPSR